MKALPKLYNQMLGSLQQHAERVSTYAVIMAKYAMGDLQAEYNLDEAEMLDAIRAGCLYHDIGKLFAPAMQLLEKKNIPEHLRSIAHSHVKDGYMQIEKHGKSSFKKSPQYLRVVSDIVLYHHERPDGTGYPVGLLSSEIPSASGLCALANKLDHLYESYDATGERRFEFVENLITEQCNHHFTEKSVDWFFSARNELSAFYMTRHRNVG